MFKELIHKADLQNGYYLNPILDGDYPDPAVMRDGDVFYLCVSTGPYFPGLTIFYSTDLVNWTTLCHPLAKFQPHAWAPDILKLNDIYYIYFCANGSNWVIWSKYIDRDWSEPIDLKLGNLDPGHCVDENGKRFLLVSDNYMVPLSDDGLSVCGERKQILKAPKIPDEWDIEGAFPEAPNVFKRDGFYYLTYADGGTTGPGTSHMIMSARATSLEGPWELSPYNPIVHTYNRNELWLSKGHGHFVDDIAGNWWVIYHAYERDLYTAGRKLLLSPITFTDDGWFYVDTLADMATLKPAGERNQIFETLSDSFCEGSEMPLQWRSFKNTFMDRVRRTDRGLILKASETSCGYSNPLTIITGDRSFEITVSVSPEQNCEAGLIYIYNEVHFNAFSLKDGVLKIYRMGAEIAKCKIGEMSCSLKMKIVKGYLSFWYSLDGKHYKKVNYVIDTNSQTTLAYHGFLSLRPGIFAIGKGNTLFSDFKYTGLQ